MNGHAMTLSIIAPASLLLLLAHIMRSARWALLFPAHYLTRRFNLLLGLAIGYAVDIVVPLRIGEIVRAWFVCRRDRIRFSYVLATVVVERMCDLLVVGAIIAALLWFDPARGPASWALPVWMVAVVAAALLVTTVIRRSSLIRRLVWRGASIFNDRINLAIADFFWSLGEIIDSRTVLRWRFVAGTVVMWSLYLAAYIVFGRAILSSGADVLRAMVGDPLHALLFSPARMQSLRVPVLLLGFTGAPILAILLYGVMRDQHFVGRAVDVVRQRGKSGVNLPSAMRNRFKTATTYEQFLRAMFRGDNQLVSGFGQEAIGDCIVHKFFNGGSDAITALVEVESHLFIRKFALGAAGDKLRIQSEWLHRRHDGSLPLVEVIAARNQPSFHSFDMPLVTPANDFYDVIHTSPPQHGQMLLSRVVDHLARFHAATQSDLASEQTIRAYLDVKAVRNAQAIAEFARSLLPEEGYSINGVQHDFAEWNLLADPDWLMAQIRDRRVADIHGDLTIENIIVAPDRPDGFYIIDPNPENVFDTPLIDWAKLMQSLHLGYETLNRGLSVELDGAAIRLSSVRSQAYAGLHAGYETELRQRHGDDALREIYFHEIINYLRLTTYKIRQSSTRGLGFFACTAILLRRYLERVAAAAPPARPAA